MTILLWGLALVVGFILSMVVGLVLFALPATFSLPRGQRPGVEPLTIAQAAGRLRQTGCSGAALVEAARKLVGERMQYCRRNSFNLYGRAFERGYGYCQQSAYALASLLKELGFDARVVTAVRNEFPGPRITGHAWVRVVVDGQTRDIDPLFYDPVSGKLAFIPVTKVFEYTTFFRFFAGWGSAAVNAYRYYKTGKDYE